MGAVALPPLAASQAGPGPNDVLWFGLLPSSPHPSPTDASMPLEQPRTERLLAIWGRFPGPARTAGCRRPAQGWCWRPLAWVVSSPAESLIYLVQKL